MMKPYIEKRREELVSLRRHFHMYPEVSMQEFQTAERIEEELDKLQIPHRRVGETGVMGILGRETLSQGTPGRESHSKGTLSQGNPSHGISGENIPKENTLSREGEGGCTVVLRADIDALRIQDTKRVSYASRHEGVMHACGHDAHTAALLGAAAALKEEESRLNGTVRLFFQQGEEYGQGARIFIREGLLQRADRVFGIHVASNIPVGCVGLSAGPVNASVDHFTIRVTGKCAHVSTPHLGVDALYTAAQIVNALQAIVSRQTNPTDTVVVGIGVLQAGDAYNIVAGSAQIEGTTRCFTQEIREITNRRVREIAEAVGKANGAEISVEFENFGPPLVNDRAVCDEVREVAAGIVGEEHVVPRELSLAGDDFAEYLLHVPGAYAFVGTGNPANPDTTAAQHAHNYDIDEEGILIAANLYTDYAMKMLLNT